MKYQIKYFLESLTFLKVFFSPFVRPKIGVYFGEIQHGVPYFLPRKIALIENTYKFVPRKFGFNFCSLGWKTKWYEDDFRFEWSPILSFVAFNKQFLLWLIVPAESQYWESWLAWEKCIDKRLPTEERIKQLIAKYPQIYTVYTQDSESTVNYYTLILKNKWLKLIKK